MPFTLSHAAAVLPAVRRTGRARGPLVASALVLGSFAPDTFYFLDAVVEGVMRYGTFTHSIPGVLTADAALTAALAAWWLLLREPLIALLPRGQRGRVHAFVRGEHWRERRQLSSLAVWFYLSAVVGSLTHVVWDSFTHLDRWGTNALPGLGEPLAFGLPLYTYLQYGSSALAACALLWFTVTGLRRLPASPVPASVPVLGRGELWCAVALLVVCVAAGVTMRVVRLFTFFDRIRTPLDIIPTVCFGAGGGLAVALLLYGVLVRLLHRSDRPDRPGRRDRAHADGADGETRTPVPTA
ncbi:DUF4184 family protein [Streptomyces sp. ISL-86]|uniref:DUF4184 family protein n=1 Tax=Streptomyces sp. ISL-86 TaxID=2819187 RepID=UPI001BE74DF6|nr:DUF4184 family protein [Streptomyces sp. ISL-86]MBT2458574.1 DUF4184 family protein [Streptomyces sp. ISL-86]